MLCFVTNPETPTAVKTLSKINLERIFLDFTMHFWKKFKTLDIELFSFSFISEPIISTHQQLIISFLSGETLENSMKSDFTESHLIDTSVLLWGYSLLLLLITKG